MPRVAAGRKLLEEAGQHREEAAGRKLREEAGAHKHPAEAAADNNQAAADNSQAAVAAGCWQWRCR
jgi:hypothetical protein